MTKHNLCVIGLYKTVKPLANRIADTLDMYFADIDELIAFDLLDVKLTQEVCGREYLLKIEGAGRICRSAPFCIGFHYLLRTL